MPQQTAVAFISVLKSYLSIKDQEPDISFET